MIFNVRRADALRVTDPQSGRGVYAAPTLWNFVRRATQTRKRRSFGCGLAKLYRAALYRRIAFCGRSASPVPLELSEALRLQIGDTADYKSALRRCRFCAKHIWRVLLESAANTGRRGEKNYLFFPFCQPTDQLYFSFIPDFAGAKLRLALIESFL